MTSDEKDNPYVKISHRPSLYVLDELDADNIDGLISTLGLAISEILWRRAVHDEPLAPTPAQDDFAAQADMIMTEGRLIREKLNPTSK